MEQGQMEKEDKGMKRKVNTMQDARDVRDLVEDYITVVKHLQKFDVKVVDWDDTPGWREIKLAADGTHIEKGVGFYEGGTAAKAILAASAE